MRFTTEIKQIEQRLGALGLKPHNVASEVARRAKIDPTTYRRWRNGETEPSYSNRQRIDAALAKIEKEAADGKHILARRRRRKPKKARR